MRDGDSTPENLAVRPAGGLLSRGLVRLVVQAPAPRLRGVAGRSPVESPPSAACSPVKYFPVLLLLLLLLPPDRCLSQSDPGRAEQAALPLTVAYSRHFSQGVEFYDAGNYARAADDFRAAAEINPEDAASLYNLGLSLGALGRPAEALAAYRRALALKPAHAGARLNLCLTLNETGRPDEALPQCKRAIALRPNNPYGFLGFGTAYALLSRHEEAAYAFNLALRLKPNMWEASYRLGKVYYDWGRYDEALEALESAERLSPRPAEVRRTAEEFTRGLSLADSTFKVNTDEVRFIRLANAFRRLGQYKNAVSACKKAVSVAPHSATAFYYLGLAYYGSGDFNAASGAYARAAALDPKLAEAQYGLAWVYHLLGKRRQSEARREAVCRLAPELGRRLSLYIAGNKCAQT